MCVCVCVCSGFHNPKTARLVSLLTTCMESLSVGRTHVEVPCAGATPSAAPASSGGSGARGGTPSGGGDTAATAAAATAKVALLQAAVDELQQRVQVCTFVAVDVPSMYCHVVGRLPSKKTRCSQRALRTGGGSSCCVTFPSFLSVVLSLGVQADAGRLAAAQDSLRRSEEEQVDRSLALTAADAQIEALSTTLKMTEHRVTVLQGERATMTDTVKVGCCAPCGLGVLCT